MKQLLIPAAGLLALLTASEVYPITPDELMNQAMANGKASGVITGKLSDNLKAITHSTDPTHAVIERVSQSPDKCQVYTFTLIQPNVPDRSGKIVGDYTTVTRNKLCPDDRKYPPEVIDCKIGTVSCMQPPAGANPAPALKR